MEIFYLTFEANTPFRNKYFIIHAENEAQVTEIADQMFGDGWHETVKEIPRSKEHLGTFNIMELRGDLVAL